MENSDQSIPDRTSKEIEQFIQAFEGCFLPKRLWTHHAHLTVGLWYLTRQDIGEATLSIRYGIQRYNQSCGVPMTKDGGYHETITLFYIWAIGKYLQEAGRHRSLSRLTKGLLQSPWGDRGLALTYYSKERLMSWEARTRWIEPDLRPLED